MKGLSLVSFFLFNLILLRGQDQYFDDDAAVWVKSQFEKDMGSGLDLRYTLQFRFNNNVSQLGQVANDFGIRYRLNKHFKLMLHYVIRNNRMPGNYYMNTQQIYTGMFARTEIGRFTLRYRLRLQTRIREGEQPGLVFWPNSSIRNKFYLYYELQRNLKIYTAYEIASPIADPESLGYNRSRTYIGFLYRLNRNSALEPYFMLQRQYSLNNQPHRDFVYGLNWNYNF